MAKSRVGLSGAETIESRFQSALVKDVVSTRSILLHHVMVLRSVIGDKVGDEFNLQSSCRESMGS